MREATPTSIHFYPDEDDDEDFSVVIDTTDVIITVTFNEDTVLYWHGDDPARAAAGLRILADRLIGRDDDA